MADPNAFSTEQWVALAAGVGGLIWLVSYVLTIKTKIRQEMEETVHAYLDSGKGRKQVVELAQTVTAVQFDKLLNKLDRITDSVDRLVKVTEKHEDRLIEHEARLLVMDRAARSE